MLQMTRGQPALAEQLRGRRPIKISFIHSIYHKRDGVSLNMRDQIRTLTEAPGRPYDIRIFVGDTSFDDPRTNVVRRSTDILRNAHFRESRALIFQWGVYYDAYDIVFAALPHQRKLTYFHNITPSRLFTDPAVKAAIALGEQQMDNLFYSDFILCNSTFSMNDLVMRGIPRRRLDVLCPVHFIPARSTAGRSPNGPAQLLYVGRFVPHKGARELVLALAEARRSAAAPFHLKLVGSLRYSDHNYIDQLRSIISAEGLEDAVTFLGELSDDALGAEFARAHALVMPSYHEGFCLPVVEALSAGCYVIAFDGGNLPYLVGDLGTVIPAGDVSALGAALVDFVGRVARPMERRRYRTSRGELPVSSFENEARRYASQFTSYDAFRGKFIASVERMLAEPDQSRPAGDDAGSFRSVDLDPAAAPDGSPGARVLRSTSERLAALEAAYAERRKVMRAAQNVIEMRGMDPRWRKALLTDAVRNLGQRG